MPTETATYRGTRQNLYQQIRELPRILTGQAPDPAGIARGLQLRLGVALLSLIQQDFIRKARGERGQDGIQWKPLAPSTIAARRLGPADRKAITLKARGKAGGLTPAEKRKIEADIRKRAPLLQVKFGLGEGQAHGLAKAQAEAAARRSGKVASIFSVLSARSVEILRDTGELFRSFSPGVEDVPSGADGQIFETPTGKVIVGTNKKPWHHTGAPPHLPARPNWPLDGVLPDVWWRALLGAYQRGLVRVVVLLLRRT